MTGYVPDGYIYFVRPGGSASHYGGVKIGFSKDPASRLKVIQSESCVKLRLWAQVKGTIVEEKLIHRAMKDYRMYGEWFRTCVEVNQFLSKIYFGKRLPPRRILQQMAHKQSIFSGDW